MKDVLKIGCLLGVFTPAAYSDCVPHICQDVFVERLYSNVNGLVYLATSGDETKLDCNAVSNTYLSFDVSDAAGDVFYSTLLAAQVSDRRVSIRIITGSEGCRVQYIQHDRQ